MYNYQDDEVTELRKEIEQLKTGNRLHLELAEIKETEIERLREDLDLTQKIARIEIDAKIRYAWALSEITKLKPDEEFGVVPIETAQRIASDALKWRE